MLMEMVGEMMPAGQPAFIWARYHPSIPQLVAECGKATIMKAVFMLIKDFSQSINVVRNLSEDQMIEIAHQLVAEAGSFRLEDYAMMFALAKRGKLVKIMDRLDMEVISKMVDEYDRQSGAAGQQARDADFQATEDLGPSSRASDGKSRMEIVGEKMDGLAEAMRYLRGEYLEYREETDKKI